MATTKPIKMTQYNGTDYDTLLPYGVVKSGTYIPNTNTVGVKGELYLFTSGSNYALYQCVNVSGSTYTWQLVGSLSTTAPANLASTASVGTANTAARADHVHALPTLTQLGAQSKIRYGTSLAGVTGSEGDIYITI